MGRHHATDTTSRNPLQQWAAWLTNPAPPPPRPDVAPDDSDTPRDLLVKQQPIEVAVRRTDGTSFDLDCQPDGDGWLAVVPEEIDVDGMSGVTIRLGESGTVRLALAFSAPEPAF